MGKSATGKDTIYKKLLDNKKVELHKLITYTTRPIREGEIDGVEYYFSSIEAYEEYRSSGKIVESRYYDTVHGRWYYYMVNDKQVDIYSDAKYLLIGTLESFAQIKEYYGKDNADIYRN